MENDCLKKNDAVLPETADDDVEKRKKKPPKVHRKKHIKDEKKLNAGWSIAILALTAVFSSTGLVFFMSGSGQHVVSIVGAVMALLMAFVTFGCYLMLRHREVASSMRKMLFISAMLIIIEVLTPVTMSVNIGFAPPLLAVLMIAIMVSEETAMVACLPLSVTAGVYANAVYWAGTDPLAISVGIAVSGVMAVFALSMRKTRSSTVIASSIAGIAGVLSYAFVMMAGGEIFNTYVLNLVWLMGSCLLCGILTVGLMPIFEAAFDIASEARLNELLNNDNPLLKRLINEAPGTYHHSMLVASLGDAAAQAVGANALLVRVSAFYHDVGKLRCPSCFKENQKGTNMHDELDPYESAKRIIAHQADGAAMLEKAKFPRDVIRIVGRHHGDSVMVYFYDKAKKQAGGEYEVDESLFRYPSVKPNTKEGAILMLADCCEAAVRSMNTTDMTEISNKIKEVITHKWDKRDSMLWDSPLTFAEIKRIEKSFCDTFDALNHERVEYPDLEEINVR